MTAYRTDSDRTWKRMLLCLAVVALVAVPVFAQDTSSSTTTTTTTATQQEPAQGVTFGAYSVSQTFEYGGRIVDFEGSQDTWNTFVNLHTGPRLLEHTLNMRSEAGAGILFDDLFLTSFGYGGDPNNVTNLRIGKNRWYDFRGLFRRDKNYFNYNVLANPLNIGPTGTTNPATFFTPGEYNLNSSAHPYYNVRRMTDLALTIAPKSAISGRLGYSRYVQSGPSIATYYEGEAVRLAQDLHVATNNYTIGVDARIARRTKLSYTQYLNWFKNDTSYEGRDQQYQLPNGVPVDPGILREQATPCAAPFGTGGGGTGTRLTDPDTLNPTCIGFITYSRFQPSRRMFPTEQLSFVTNYWKRLNLSIVGAYNSMDYSIADFDEQFTGLVSRTRQRAFDITGPIDNRRISATADVIASFRITNNLTLSNTFRWNDYRIVSAFDMTEQSFFGTNMTVAPNIFSPANCPPPFTAATCPQHATASPADVLMEVIRRNESADQKINTLELAYSFGSKGGVRAGYRYRNQFLVHDFTEDITSTFFPGGVAVTARSGGAGCSDAGATDAQGICTLNEVDTELEEYKVTQHAALFGVWLRPVQDLRMSLDVEFMRGSTGWHRLYPSDQQRFKFKTTYRPQQWLNITGGFNILEVANDAEDIDHDRHSRNYNIGAIFMRSENLSLDVAYNFSDIGTITNICYLPTGTVPAGSTAACAVITDSFWNSNQHYVNTAISFKPVKRLTTAVGLNMNIIDGDALLTQPGMPSGLVKYNYFAPSAMLGVNLTDRWMFKTAWNYYGYDEDNQNRGFIAARDTSGNVVTLSLRYAF